ncbi:MAG: hypothetical protein PHP92_05760 [Candidatus Nanoarchaeia archaeon]|nr:hypothetical protein [Candidatus Nanoarchaeia archaeon]
MRDKYDIDEEVIEKAIKRVIRILTSLMFYFSIGIIFFSLFITHSNNFVFAMALLIMVLVLRIASGTL